MQNRTPSRNAPLMSLYTIERNFLQHRQKIIKTQRKDMSMHVKKSYQSQMEMINSFRKNWRVGNQYKNLEKQRAICGRNRALHDMLEKEYNRDKFKVRGVGRVDTGIAASNPMTLSRTSLQSSRSKNSIKNAEIISQQNRRMLKKISQIQSTLSRDKFEVFYKRTRENKQKLQVFSLRNKQRTRNSLRKMNVEVNVVFPGIKKKYSDILKYN